MQISRRLSTGAPKGNRKTWKYWNYSAKEQARRVAMKNLPRMRSFAG
jgi:hypothetical protein